MRAVLRRMLMATLSLALVASVAAAGAVDVAKPRDAAGTSSLLRDGKTVPVAGSTQFQEGDIVRVPTDGRLTIEFGDGATLALVGPAGLRFGPMNPLGRRVVLGSGVITEATIYGIAVEIQAPNPYDCSLVLQNARAFARVNPGESVQFQKLEGVYAKAYLGDKPTDLGQSPWLLNARDGSVAMGVPPRGLESGSQGPLKETALANDAVRIMLNGRPIVFQPARSFKREKTTRGGLLLCFAGAEGEWGTVDAGRETTLFLAPGNCVEFDANGNVIRFDGIMHVYEPLYDWMERDPIENAIDASPSYSKKR